MSMEQFFEAWVETLMSHVARRIGGIVRSGRERQTVVPLNWDPPYLGSQKSLALRQGKYGPEDEPGQDAEWINHIEAVRGKIGPDGVKAALKGVGRSK